MCVRGGYPAYAQTVEIFENWTLTQRTWETKNFLVHLALNSVL